MGDEQYVEQNTDDSQYEPAFMHDIPASERPHIPVLRQLSVTLGLLILVFGVTYVSKISTIFGGTTSDAHEKQAAQVPAASATTTPVAATTTDPFSQISLRARAAYVWDVNNQRALFKKNPDEQLPLASVTKLMTALVAYELIGDKANVPITVSAVEQDGNSGLSPGELFSSKRLTDLTLISSSNDGAYALAAAAGNAIPDGAGEPTFVHAMNIRAKDLGLSQTHYNNPTGLDVSTTTSGGYGSARDMAFLMEYLITHYPQVVELTRDKSTTVANEAGQIHNVGNTNEIVTDIPGIIASKTGYTDLAGGNLVVAFDAGLNRPIIISVLGSTINGRFDDMETLIHAVTQYLAKPS